MRGIVTGTVFLIWVGLTVVAAQKPQLPSPPGRPGAEAPAAAPTAAPDPDPLGRETPKGSVLGFLNAARSGDLTLAAQYLDTRLTGASAEDLARQLFVVLDARLPARLTQITERPEGSLADPLQPDREPIGTVESAAGNVTVSLRRLTRRGSAPLWYFSGDTLELVPRLHAEIAQELQRRRLPEVLSGTTLGGLRLIDWLVVVIAIPLFLVAMATLNRMLALVLRPLWRPLRGQDPPARLTVLPVPARLLLLALLGPWLFSWLPLSLLARQFLTSGVSVVVVVAIVWLLILLNGAIERLIRRRLPTGTTAAVSLLRLGRRAVDGLVIFCGFFGLLWRFGIDPTPALAGIGVGGIALALAAQRTLENIIAGASLVFDQAVRVGDYLRVGVIEGTVDHIGLRSTRIRTLDRTVVSVPNSQIASASVETLSARDKYWFHPEIHLRHDTTTEQLSAVLDGIRRLLHEHTHLDRHTIRVRFIRIGPYSLDVEVFAYVFARDWNHFLELQEGLLFGVTQVVEGAGTTLAAPFQPQFTPSAEKSY